MAPKERLPAEQRGWHLLVAAFGHSATAEDQYSVGVFGGWHQLEAEVGRHRLGAESGWHLMNDCPWNSLGGTIRSRGTTWVAPFGSLTRVRWVALFGNRRWVAPYERLVVGQRGWQLLVIRRPQKVGGTVWPSECTWIRGARHWPGGFLRPEKKFKLPSWNPSK